MADHIRYYRFLLKLYPARFREEFAAPLERQFSDEYRETHGAGLRAIFWLRTLADWAVTVPAEMARELRQDVRYAVRVYRRRTLDRAGAERAGPRYRRHHGRLQRAQCRAVPRLAVSRRRAPGGSPGSGGGRR